MEALNKPERRKAFTNFLIFFSITAALIIAAAFFSMEVPFKQNEQLREQITMVERERNFSENFWQNMNALGNLFDSLDKKDANVVLVDGKIDDKLREMEAMIDKDSISVKNFYHDVVLHLFALHTAKKELREATSKDANLSELKEQISQLKDDLSRSENNNAILQAALKQR